MSKKLKLTCVRGGQSKTVQLYYVLGHKPAGGMVVRVIIKEDLDLHKNDTLIFDFTNEVNHAE